MMKTWIEIMFEIVVTVGLADFVAGFVHWFEDAYVREDTPLIGTAVGKPNVIHHHLPRYFTRFSWWYSSRDLLLISCLIVLAAWGFGLLTWQVLLFAAVSTNANEVHKWSHRTRKENGRVLSFLQDIRVLQTPRHHAIHHTNPKNCHYCPITNLVNPGLDRLHFWDGLEWFLARTIRLHRRPDTSLPDSPVPAWVEELRREGESKKPVLAVAAPPKCDCAKCPRKTNRENPCRALLRMKPAERQNG
jgi:ubiquitin-conjugating enzyme E2 variant